MSQLRSAYCDVFFFQAEDGIRDLTVTGVQTLCSSDLPPASRCAQPPAPTSWPRPSRSSPRCRARRSRPTTTCRDRKSVVKGKSVDLGGRRIIKKKKKKN